MKVDCVAVKRVYDPPEEAAGKRVLVDRLWPRGLTKEKARVDVWLKAVAPSTELRRWYHSGGEWEEFARRYRAELEANPDAVAEAAELVRGGAVTLLYGVKDRERNHALLLRDFLERNQS